MCFGLRIQWTVRIAVVWRSTVVRPEVLSLLIGFYLKEVFMLELLPKLGRLVLRGAALLPVLGW